MRATLCSVPAAAPHPVRLSGVLLQQATNRRRPAWQRGSNENTTGSCASTAEERDLSVQQPYPESLAQKNAGPKVKAAAARGRCGRFSWGRVRLYLDPRKKPVRAVRPAQIQNW